VTLCSEPARPGSWVFYKVPSLISLANYKRIDISRGYPYTRAMPDAVMEPVESPATTVVAASAEVAKQSPLEVALAGVANEEHRRLIAERFTQMVAATDAEKSKAEEAEKRRQELEKQLKEQTVTSKINQEMLQNQLQMLQDNVGKELSSTFHLHPQSTQCAIESGDPAVVRETFERALMAANRRMMQLQADAAVGASSMRKRSREVDETSLPSNVVAASEAVAAAAAPEVAEPSAVVAASAPVAMNTSSDTGSLLERAMAATFEY